MNCQDLHANVENSDRAQRDRFPALRPDRLEYYDPTMPSPKRAGPRAKPVKSAIKFFDAMTPNLPAIDLEEGIAKLVGIFNSKGLASHLSCDGLDNGRAWVEFNPAVFKGYMRKNWPKMEAFLIAGRGRWSLTLEYVAVHVFKGIARLGIERKEIKRKTIVDLRPNITLKSPARRAGAKTAWMRDLEQAAETFL